MRYVIIEDEPVTARNLQHSIAELEDDSTRVTTLESVRQSIDWLTTNAAGYDLLFMDIRLTDGLSFRIFDEVEINSPVIFVTAYDDYALQAFKTNGIDYILKPFEKGELERALHKFKKLAGMPTSKESKTQLVKTASQLKDNYGAYKQSFLVHMRDKLIPLAAKEIAWFYTVKETSWAYTFDKRKYVVDFTLEQLQQQLDPNDFFRANRQFIVQRKTIAEVEFYFNGRLLLKINPAAEENVLISKARVPEFKLWMNQ
jgi:two-component system LytT family response regulator